MNESDLYRELVGECQRHCLWFVDPKKAAAERETQLAILGFVERYGNRVQFQRARRLKQWLLQHSSAAFAVS
jgi:hypothetical protein